MPEATCFLYAEKGVGTMVEQLISEKRINFRLNRALRTMDPECNAIKEDVKSAMHSREKIDGSRRVVHVCPKEFEGRYLYVWDEVKINYRPVAFSWYGEGKMGKEQYDTDIPSHWNAGDAEDYMNLRFKGHPISEKLYDLYVKSGERELVFSYDYSRSLRNFSKFFKPIYEHFTENIAKGMKRDEALNSAYTLVSAKKRLRKEIAENQQIKQAVLTGIKKTGEKGYKHVNEVERTAEGLKDIGFIVKRADRNK